MIPAVKLKQEIDAFMGELEALQEKSKNKTITGHEAIKCLEMMDAWKELSDIIERQIYPLINNN